VRRVSDPRRIWILCVAGALTVGLALAWRVTRRDPRGGLRANTPTSPARQAASFTAPFGNAVPNSSRTAPSTASPAGDAPESNEDEAALQRGTAAFQAGRDAEAVNEFMRVVRTNPRMPIARAYLGLVYVRQKKFAEAMKQFEEEARLLPNPAFALAHIADVHYAKGDLPSAINALEKATRLKPDVAQLHFNLGMLYPQSLELGKGLEALNRCLELEPENHYAQYLRGNLLYKLARLDEAQAGLEESIRLSPRTGLYHFGLGQVHLRRKGSAENTDRALSEFQRALDLGAPEPAAVHYHLGLCYQRMQDWESSRRELKTSTDMAPEAWGAFYALAETLQKLGRAEDARIARARFSVLRQKEDLQMQQRFHEQEVQRNPQSPEARYQLAAFQAKQGDREKALRTAASAADLAKARKAEPSLRDRIAALSAELSRSQGRR